MNEQMGGRVSGPMGGRPEGRVDRWVDRQPEGRVDA